MQSHNQDQETSMDSSSVNAILASLLFFVVLILMRKQKKKHRLPPGSLGIPIIGQSLQLLQAMRANRGEDWLRQRINRYGPISKLNVFGNRSVLVHGPAANKFIYTSNEKVLSNQQPTSIRRLLGQNNLLELSGEDHKRVRGAMMSFLNPEALRLSIHSMDQEIRLHLNQHWLNKHQIKVMPLMKTLTFDVICSLIFGIERGARRDKLVALFQQVIDGMLALPINLPFTRFGRSLSARSEIRDVILQLIRERRAEADQRKDASTPDHQHHHHHQDLMTRLISIKGDHVAADSSPLLSDEEIVDNCMIAMTAGHDTTSILLTFLIKLLSENPHVYETVLNEQEEIAKGKVSGEPLTWDELTKMKYTWRVATESLRMYPPVFCSFRKVLQDIELGGYIIPKGWQVFWSPCITHMDGSIYPDPLKFDPSRHENQGAVPPYSYIAFGAGPRMCPGYEFARIETLTMIHYLVTGFKWKLCLQENLFGRDPMPVFGEGLPIQVEMIRTD